jgi:predicted TIM-barrel fold metal-dependent hydrolase
LMGRSRLPRAAAACYKAHPAEEEGFCMKNGMVIIDADGHAVDYEPVYRERLPEQYRNRATIYPADNFDRTQNGKLAAKRPPSPAQNLADNAQEGIDLQIIYPTGGLMLTRVRERDYAIALCRAYNDWLYDWCAIDRKRLKAVALVPLHVDTRAAIDEMERAVSKLGDVGVMVNTYDRSRNIAHRDFCRFMRNARARGCRWRFTPRAATRWTRCAISRISCRSTHCRTPRSS